MNKNDITNVTLEKRSIFEGTGELCRGRVPIAYADICGEQGYGAVKGEASFYYTPIGVLVRASVSGLDGKSGVYSLSLTSPAGRRQSDASESAIPPLYDRNGYAWCSALTKKLSPCELLGKRISMRALHRGAEQEEIASGVIRACEKIKIS